MAATNSTRPSRAHILELVNYDRNSGRVRKKPKPETSCDYRTVVIDGIPILEHHLVWLIETGDWPKGDIDHINGNRRDNRIENLRDVSHKENLQNQRKAQVSNKSTGLLGVTKRSNGKFAARILHKGKNLHIGTFMTAPEAHQAYLDAKRMLHAGCTI